MSHAIYCSEQLRQHDNDQFICCLFAPSDARAGMHAIYAFNLEIARSLWTVQEPILAQMRIQWWRERIESINARKSTKHPVVAALNETISHFRLPLDPFYKILAARENELTGTLLPDMPALIDHAEATKASLSLLSLHILKASAKSQLRSAEFFAEQSAVRNVGVSGALIGLLRAIPFHAAAQRSYLPRDLCTEYGLNIENLDRRGQPAELADVVAAVAKSARNHLMEARSFQNRVSSIALPALLPAVIADVYLKRLAAAQYNPFHPSVQHSGITRLILTTFRALQGRY